MSDGELGAVFRGLAEDVGEAGGEIAESIAKFTDGTAAIEDANVDRTLAADAENARAANAIVKDTDPESESAGAKSDFAGRVDNSEANSEIDSFIGGARDIEPKLTNEMMDISESVPGSELAGSEFRLKAQDSLQRKVATDLLENPNMSTKEALSQIKDSVRYTMKIPAMATWTASTRRSSDCRLTAMRTSHGRIRGDRMGIRGSTRLGVTRRPGRYLKFSSTPRTALMQK